MINMSIFFLSQNASEKAAQTTGPSLKKIQV